MLAGILRERFGISDALYGGLLIYAVGTTLLPSFVLPGLTQNTLNALAREAEV